MPHIHNLIDFTVGAFIVFQNKALLVQHKELNMWLPVGGHIELDEDIEQALFREIEEETGLKPNQIVILAAKPKINDRRTKFLPAPAYADIHWINKNHRHIGLAYFVKSKTDKVRLEKREHHEIQWFTRKDLDDKKYKLRPAIKFYAKEALRRIK